MILEFNGAVVFLGSLDINFFLFCRWLGLSGGLDGLQGVVEMRYLGVVFS